jgi:hypothetical protein
MAKQKVDINKINEIISHIGYAQTVIEEAQKKVLLLDLSNIPQGEDLKKQMGALFVESTIKFESVYNIIAGIWAGEDPKDIVHARFSTN